MDLNPGRRYTNGVFVTGIACQWSASFQHGVDFTDRSAHFDNKQLMISVFRCFTRNMMSLYLNFTMENS
jgi:hypothetical protein